MSHPVATIVQRLKRLGRRARTLQIAALIAAGGCAPAMAEANVSLDFGLRFLDERTWGPLDSQAVAGLRFDYAQAGWPVRLTIGLNASDAEATTSEPAHDSYGVGCLIPPFTFLCLLSGESIERTVARASLQELSLGADKGWVTEGEKARAFLGGGVAVVRASIEDLELAFSHRGSSAGLWAHAGLLRMDRAFTGAVRFEYGAEIKVLRGTELEVGRASVDVDYLQVGLILGIGWPS